jgi:ribosomal protein S18 acetylase RimI-like enzyme
MLPEDGPAMMALGEQSPETGAIAFHSQFHYDPYAALLALRPTTTGVVAEAPGHPGLAGLALLNFGECNYEDSVRPFAYFYSLSVHPNYRRLGLGSQLAAWRVEQVRKRFRAEAVMISGIQSGNVG